MEPVKLVEQAIDTTGRVVDSIRPDQLSQPTPCTEWDVRTLLNHTVGVITMIGNTLTGAEQAAPDGDLLGDDPQGAYQRAAKTTLEAWRSIDSLEQKVTMPGRGEIPAAVAARINFLDTLVHGWDLNKATGAGVNFDDEVCRIALEQARAVITEEVREKGPFGSEVSAPEGCSDADRLAAFFGRQI